MTELYNALKNIAADSTVKTVAVGLAVGGFLANAAFGLGKTTFSLVAQGVSAAVTLGIVAASAYKKQQQNQEPHLPAEYKDKTSENYFYQAVQQQSIQQPAIEPDRFHKTFTPSISKADKKSGDTYKNILNTAYGFGHQEKISPSWGPMPTNTAQTFTVPESPKKRGNIYTQTLDIAYGSDNHADIYPWGRKRLY